jgi:hypothetical protein
MAATVGSLQIDHGTAAGAGAVVFSEKFAAAPSVVGATPSAVTASGFTAGAAGDWIAIGPSERHED